MIGAFKFELRALNSVVKVCVKVYVCVLRYKYKAIPFLLHIK